jgi:hypothetical protein
LFAADLRSQFQEWATEQAKAGKCRGAQAASGGAGAAIQRNGLCDPPRSRPVANQNRGHFPTVIDASDSQQTKRPHDRGQSRILRTRSLDAIPTPMRS